MKTRTKFLALVMTCVMLLGVVAMVVPASADASALDVKYDLDQYGYADYVVGAAIATAPEQNAEVAANEYTLKIESPKTDTKHNGTGVSDITEYFAYDDQYIYYAITATDFTIVPYIYVRLFPDQSGMAGQSWFNAIQVQANRDTETGLWSVIMAGGRNNERDHYDKVSNTNRFAEADDMVGAAKVDGTTFTLEFKIDRMELTLCHCPGGNANTATEPYKNIRFLAGGFVDSSKWVGNLLDDAAATAVKASDANYKNSTTLGRSVTFDTVANFDIRTDLPSIYVGAAATTAPAQDGAVAETEYTYSRFTAADKMVRGSSDTTEYFAYDADYVYIAVVIEDAEAGKDNKLYMCFWTADDGRAGASWFNRDQFLATINDDGTVTLAENGLRNLSQTHPKPTTGKNGSAVAAGKFDATTNIAVFEFKFKRTELAEIFGGTEAVQDFRYTWFTADEAMMVQEYKADSAEGLKVKDNDQSMTGQSYKFGINVVLRAAATGDLAINASTKPVPTTAPATTVAPATEAPAATTAAPAATTKAPAATTAAPADDAAPAATTAAAEKKGCKGSLTVSALALLPIIAGGVVIARKRED